MEKVQKPGKTKKNKSRSRAMRQTVDVKEEARLRKAFQEVWGSSRATTSHPTESRSAKRVRKEKTGNTVTSPKSAEVHAGLLQNVSPLVMMRSSLKKMKASSVNSPNTLVVKPAKKTTFVHVDEPVRKKNIRTSNKKKKAAVKLKKNIVNVLPPGILNKSSQKEGCSADANEAIIDKKGRRFFDISSSSFNLHNAAVIRHSGKAWTIDRASDPIILYPLVQKSVQNVNSMRSLGEQTDLKESFERSLTTQSPNSIVIKRTQKNRKRQNIVHKK